MLILAGAGCATAGMMGSQRVPLPPEYDQKVLLLVDDNYVEYQATRPGYDIGDLQSFHSQHTFPMTVEDAFKEIFGKVEVLRSSPQIEIGSPDVPAIFEVRIMDLGHDTYIEADSYRANITVAVAMKSPRGKIFWQEAFRGDGYIRVDPQFSSHLGPQDAVVAAVRDVMDQIKTALRRSPDVSNQLKYYQAIDAERQGTEIKV
ncbi:MAG: hypothetical protein Q8R76_09920 [Candidatus Omnitrophota bacterium]|nr:hypothetical protein [Candidatus Omnitrophota bacterium]